MAVRTNFDDAFTNGLVLRGGSQTFDISVANIGAFTVASGQIGIIDPICSNAGASIRPVPNGDHQVTLSIATDINHRCFVAAAKICFDPTQPIKFEDFQKFDVDSGICCLTDASNCEGLNYPELQNKISTISRGGEFYFHDEKRVICINSGFGDGTYTVWIGKSANGTIATLVVDFEVLLEFHEKTFLLPLNGHLFDPDLLLADISLVNANRTTANDGSHVLLIVCNGGSFTIDLVNTDGTLLLKPQKINGIRRKEITFVSDSPIPIDAILRLRVPGNRVTQFKRINTNQKKS